MRSFRSFRSGVWHAGCEHIHAQCCVISRVSVTPPAKGKVCAVLSKRRRYRARAGGAPAPREITSIVRRYASTHRASPLRFSRYSRAWIVPGPVGGHQWPARGVRCVVALLAALRAARWWTGAGQPLQGRPAGTTRPPSPRAQPAPGQRPASAQPAPGQRPASARPAPSQRPASAQPAPSQRPASAQPAPSQRPASPRPAPGQRPASAQPAPRRDDNHPPLPVAGQKTGLTPRRARVDGFNGLRRPQ